MLVTSQKNRTFIYFHTPINSTGRSCSTCCNSWLRISGNHGLRLRGPVELEDRRSKDCCIPAGNCSVVYKCLLHSEL